MNLIILKPSEVSWQDYRNLRLRALKDEPQAFASSYEKEKEALDEEWQNQLKSDKNGNGDWVVLAGNGEQLVGMVGAWQSDEDKKNNIANIFGVFVVNEARGKGISKLLMSSLLDLLTNTTPLKKVILGVNTDQTVAVNLYKRIGFKKIKTYNILLGDGKYHDEYVMEKELR